MCCWPENMMMMEGPYENVVWRRFHGHPACPVGAGLLRMCLTKHNYVPLKILYSLKQMANLFQSQVLILW